MKRKLIPALLAALTIAFILILAGIMQMLKANAYETPEPEKVGVLVIPGRKFPGAGREDARRIDNERKLAEKIARLENARAERTVEESERTACDSEPERKFLGRFRITGYCTCARCCGNSNGITASGTTATVGRTCAAAKGIPFGTVLYIDGIGERVVEDRGGFAANTIDVLCEDHPACYRITGWYDVWEVQND